VVSVLDSGTEGSGFKSQPRRCLVTVLGKLTVHTHRACVHQAAKLVAALLRVARVTAGLAESIMAAYRRVYDSRHQLRNLTIGNRVQATFTFYFDILLTNLHFYSSCRDIHVHGVGRKNMAIILSNLNRFPICFSLEIP